MWGLLRVVSTTTFSHACPSLQLPEQPGWYFGNIKLAEAERLLLQIGNPTGTFLIGEFEGQPGGTHVLLSNIDNSL